MFKLIVDIFGKDIAGKINEFLIGTAPPKYIHKVNRDTKRIVNTILDGYLILSNFSEEDYYDVIDILQNQLYNSMSLSPLIIVNLEHKRLLRTMLRIEIIARGKNRARNRNHISQ